MFGAIMAAVINTKNDILAAGQPVHIRDVTFCGPVYIRWYITVIKYDGWPTILRRLTVGDG